MDAQILAQTVEQVFLTMMNLEVLPSEKGWTSSHGQLTSAVHLSGAWNGALLFECGRQQACQFAARFLSVDTPEAVTPEVRDVLGELANMIGGNMKSAVATGLNLSMPSVSEGAEGRMQICEGDVQDRLAFDSSFGPFWVTLLVERGNEGEFSTCQQRAFS
jgi:CheY-specific phosphatase CheX